MAEMSSLDGAPLLVGRYQLLECLGEGGMGVVWRAFDNDLEEPVAIKFLREELARDEAVRAYFRREVKLARRVTHANVARVFEFGRDGPRYFLTMEFVDGPTLHALIGRGPLAPAQVRPIAVSLCRGLAAAHAVGVVHGDIKPGNVLIDRERGAMLTDFGIARAVSEAESGDQASGTPQYMAPELVNGSSKGSLRSDVYAVGVVLFEALTGKTPWGSTDVRNLLRLKARGVEPDLEAIAPQLPRGWIEVIQECLRTDAAARPADARALVVLLAGLRGAGDVGVRPPRTRPSALATAQGPRWIEVVPFTADDPNGSGAWVTGDVKDALAQIRGLRVAEVGGSSGAALPLAVTQVRGVVRPVDDGVVVTVDVVNARTGAPRVSFEVHQPLDELPDLGRELAARISEAVEPGLTEAIGTRPSDSLAPAVMARYVEAREALLAWRPDTALRLFEAALVEAPGHRLLQIGRCKAMMLAMLAAGEPTAAELEEARRVSLALVAEHDDLGEAHLARAIVQAAINDPVGCARSLRAALHRAPSLVMPHTMVADLLMELGRLPDAERHLDIACALGRYGVQVWSSMAALRARQGRFEEFHRIVAERVDPRLRAVIELRWTIGRADREALTRLAAALAGEQPGLSATLVAQSRDIVALLLGVGGREEVLRRLEANHAVYAQSRSACVYAQVLCELACVVGDLARARRWLAVADRHALIDRQWIEQSSAIAPLHGSPAHVVVRARVLARADAVGEAIWG